MAQPDFAYRSSAIASGDPWKSSRSPIYNDSYQTGTFDLGNSPYRSQSVAYTTGTNTSSSYNLPATVSMGSNGQFGRAEIAAHHHASPPAYNPPRHTSAASSGSYVTASPIPAPGYSSYHNSSASHQGWDHPGMFSPSDSMEDMIVSSSLSDYSGTTPPGSNSHSNGSSKNKANGASNGGGSNGSSSRGRCSQQRRSSNRDEFDGPHQFLQRPPADYIAMQERLELPHLPTNLLVQEQDSVLTQVNDRLSQCAYDFVAKYQFPIPLTQDMRPVERPQDREWTEWVYLLKRLATKRRIPARVLYNGQIKQFVTILENSLEMRHAAKHQSRPLKDDRNILQLISAGIQVAKILKDAQAMDYLDKLYVSTEKQIQERSQAAAARFR
ncbi:hypothetical protein QBC46DRAFT_156445 [Diplogelasinospora grovesii]|uniref:Uncharacterized protein n=1 Tax=Diplogelasinospora grovesii TaxID=303347 RepID=A0AAN6S928_9PEZI|nr:hypothetical protein QBC46DRAFT_156445 [Diplogelasinospora grovesii]